MLGTRYTATYLTVQKTTILRKPTYRNIFFGCNKHQRWTQAGVLNPELPFPF